MSPCSKLYLLSNKCSHLVVSTCFWLKMVLDLAVSSGAVKFDAPCFFVCTKQSFRRLTQRTPEHSIVIARKIYTMSDPNSKTSSPSHNTRWHSIPATLLFLKNCRNPSSKFMHQSSCRQNFGNTEQPKPISFSPKNLLRVHSCLSDPLDSSKEGRHGAPDLMTHRSRSCCCKAAAIRNPGDSARWRGISCPGKHLHLWNT